LSGQGKELWRQSIKASRARKSFFATSLETLASNGETESIKHLKKAGAGLDRERLKALHEN